jgi:hypothetical protein
MESECPLKCVIQPKDPTLNHSIQIYAQFIEHPFNNALPSAPSSTAYSVQVSQSKSCMHFSLPTHLIAFPFITVRLRIWRRHQIIRSFITQVFIFSCYCLYITLNVLVHVILMFHRFSQIPELLRHFDLLVPCDKTLFCTLETTCGHILKVFSVFSEQLPFGRVQELHSLWYLSLRHMT